MWLNAGAATEEERDEEEGAGVNAPLLLRIAEDDEGSVGSDDTSDWGDRSDAECEVAAADGELRREPLGGGEYTTEDQAAPHAQGQRGSAAGSQDAAPGGQELTGDQAPSPQQQTSRQPVADESSRAAAVSATVGEIEVRCCLCPALF